MAPPLNRGAHFNFIPQLGAEQKTGVQTGFRVKNSEIQRPEANNYSRLVSNCPKKGLYRAGQYQNPLGGRLIVPVVLLFLLVSEAPGPEIRILQEILSPELAGNRRKTRFRWGQLETRTIRNEDN